MVQLHRPHNKQRHQQALEEERRDNTLARPMILEQEQTHRLMQEQAIKEVHLRATTRTDSSNLVHKVISMVSSTVRRSRLLDLNQSMDSSPRMGSSLAMAIRLHRSEAISRPMLATRRLTLQPKSPRAWDK